MSKFASFLSGNAVVVGGGAAAAVAVVAVVASGVLKSPDPAPVPEPTPAVQPAPEPTPTPEPEPAVADTPTEEAAPEPVAEAEPTPESEPEAPAPILPAFDIVRVEPNGSTLIAGSGAMGAEIVVLLDEAPVANASTDHAGKFAVFLDIPPSDQARVLSLLQRLEGEELASEATVILAPTPVIASATPEPETPAEETAAVEPTPETPVDEATPEPAPEDTVVAATEPAEDQPTTEAPTVLMADEEGVTVLQGPWDESPEVMSTVALDAITYSPEGEVELSGRSGQEGFVRVYLDNAPVTTSRIAEDGNWRTELPDVDTGVYTLRVDEVNKEGDVVSRVETPFKKEEPEVIEASREAADSPAEVVTVQPGSTLWAIATDRYGEGVLYVRVYEANKDRIRDPDLIYPGQVFNLPDE